MNTFTLSIVIAPMTAYFLTCVGLIVSYLYLNRQEEEECKVSYDESEKDERIQNVRLHGRHE